MGKRYRTAKVATCILLDSGPTLKTDFICTVAPGTLALIPPWYSRIFGSALSNRTAEKGDGLCRSPYIGQVGRKTRLLSNIISSKES